MPAPAGETPRAGVRQTRHGSPCWWRACSPLDCGPSRQRWPTPLLKGPELSASGRHCSSQQISPEVFVGGSRPARSAPPVKPSAQPFPPPPRSTDGAHINPGGPTGGRQAVHQCQTNGDAYEAKRSGRARPGGPGPHDPRTSRPGEQPGLTFGCHTRRYDSWLTWKRT